MENKPEGVVVVVPGHPENQQGSISTTTSSASNTESEKENNNSDSQPKVGFGWYILIVVIIALAIGVGIRFFGASQGVGTPVVPTPNSTTPVATATSSAPLRIDYKGGSLLVVDSSGNANQITAKPVNRSTWLTIAPDDSTATSPTLSPDGTRVAYASKLDGGKIQITSLTTDTISTISSAMLKDLATNSNLKNLQVCPWTTIAWSPAGNRLAFWSCSTQETFSVCAVFDYGASPSLKLVSSTRLDSLGFRQAVWLDENHLLISNPTNTTTPIPSLITLAVP